MASRENTRDKPPSVSRNQTPSTPPEKVASTRRAGSGPGARAITRSAERPRSTRTLRVGSASLTTLRILPPKAPFVHSREPRTKLRDAGAWRVDAGARRTTARELSIHVHDRPDRCLREEGSARAG